METESHQPGNDNFKLRTQYARWVGAGGNITCPGCGLSIMRLYRVEHLAMHTLPSTRSLIERITPLLADDFYMFCVVNGYEIDGKGPKDKAVVNALADWLRYQR